MCQILSEVEFYNGKQDSRGPSHMVLGSSGQSRNKTNEWIITIISTSGNPTTEIIGREGCGPIEVNLRSGKISAGGDIWAETCRVSQHGKSRGGVLYAEGGEFAKSLSCQMLVGEKQEGVRGLMQAVT